MLLLGFLFFFTYSLTVYYINWVLVPQGVVTPAILTARDTLLQIGILISAVAIIIPSIDFKKAEEQVILYAFSAGAIVLTLGIYLGSIKSDVAIYVFYNSAAVVLILLISMLFGFLGFRGRRIVSTEVDRIAMAIMALILIINISIVMWSFSITSSGRSIAANFIILRYHSTRYAVWMVLTVFLMRFSNMSIRLNRLIVRGLIAVTIVWTLSFGLYTLDVPSQIGAGVMDGALGILIVTVLISQLKILRKQMNPHFALGTLALIWFTIAGSVALYMITLFSANQQSVPALWRLFHLMNANYSLLAGLGALALISVKYSKRLGWIVTFLFVAELINKVSTYLINVMDQKAATTLLQLGDPFFIAATLIIIYILFKETPKTNISV